MKTKLAFFLNLLILMLPLQAHANWLGDIYHALLKMYAIDIDLKNINSSQLGKLDELKNINQAQLTETSKLRSSLTGTHQFGSQYDDQNRFNWGQGSNEWQSVLALVNTGGGGGDLGNLIKTLSQQFPIKDSLGSSNETENTYYRMQAQTTIANRAGSELAFKELNNEAETMRKLHQLIDTTTDEKSAVDLNNRLSAENTMVNIQQAKLMAMLIQQQTIDAQAKVNVAKENAEFFDIK